MKTWKVLCILAVAACFGLLIASDWTPANMDGVWDAQRKTQLAVNHLTTNDDNNKVSVEMTWMEVPGT